MKPFACSQADCAGRGAPYPPAVAEALGGKCPLCHGPLSAPPTPTADTTDLARLALDHLPFPVAYPLSHALDPGLNVSERLENVLFTGYQAMRITGLVLLADYFDGEVASPHLERAIRGLRMPHWQDWTVLCTQLTAFWAGHLSDKPDRDPRFPALVEGWRKVLGKGHLPEGWAAALAGVPGHSGPAGGPNEALHKARNDRAHRMATRTADRSADAAMLARLLPLLELEVRALFPPGALTLVRAVQREPLAGIQLMGVHQDFHFEQVPIDEIWGGLFAHTDLAAFGPAQGVPVHPLIVSTDQGTAKAGGVTGLTEPVALLDGGNEKRLVVLGVRGWQDREDLVQPFREAIAAKGTDLSQDREETKPWTIADWAWVTAHAALEGMKDRKYFPECYLSRPGVDDVVAECLGRGGQGLILLGEAGSGKSSLLAHMVEGLLREEVVQDDPKARPEAKNTVLFLSGRSDYGGDAGKEGRALLCDAVLAKAGVRSGAFKDLTDFAESLGRLRKEDTLLERKTWIVLDALNEADRFKDLLAAVDQFLPALERHPWLRLVLSIRSGAWHSLRAARNDNAAHGDVLGNTRCLFSFVDERSKDERPYLDVRPFDLATEGRASYELRQTALPERASLMPYDRLAPRFRSLLLSPLHLHIFHQTYQGQERVPADLDESDLFDAYLEGVVGQGQAQGSLAATLGDIGRVMFEGRKPVLPADLADDWLDAWRRRNVGQGAAGTFAKLDPLEELVSVSVLSRPVEQGLGADRKLAAFSFSHQKLCEQVLFRHLRTQLPGRSLPRAEELLAWARHAAQDPAFPELTGALGKMAARMATSGLGADLATLLDIEDKAVLVEILGPALRALGPLWGPTQQGEALPASVLESLLHSAKQRPSPWGERFLNAVEPAKEWLAVAGFSRMAAAVDLARLEVLELLVQLEPEGIEWRRGLASCLAALGAHADDGSVGQDGRRYFDESLRIRRDLAEADPGRTDLQADLAAALASLGWQAFNQGASQEARTLLEACHQVVLRLVEGDPCQPSGFRLKLSKSFNHLGRLAQAAGRTAEAQEHYEASLKVMRGLVNEEPDRPGYLRSLSIALGHLAGVTCLVGSQEASWSLFEESIQALRHIVQLEPHRTDYGMSLSIQLNNLAVMAKNQGRVTEATRLYEESLNTMGTLVKTEPHRLDLGQEYATLLRNNGTWALQTDRLPDAVRLFEEATRTDRRLVEADPRRKTFRHSLSISLNKMGDAAWRGGRMEDACGYYQEDLALMRDLVREEPHLAELSRDLALSLSKSAQQAVRMNRIDEAWQAFNEGLEIERNLVVAEPKRLDLQRGLSVSLADCGALAIQQQCYDEARAFLTESLQVARALLGHEAHPDYQTVLLNSLFFLGSLERSVEHAAAARVCFQDMIAVAQARAELAPDVPRYQTELKLVIEKFGMPAEETDVT